MALPGVTGVDHIGFTVPDLEQARAFLVDVLGCEYLYSLGPFVHEDDWMAAHLNVHPRAVMRRNSFFRCGGQAIFEGFSYEAPDQNPGPPRNSDVGGHHIALYVADLDAAVTYLREQGVQVLGQPTASSGAHEGQRWVYFLAPWGMQFELVSYPDGKAYFRNPEAFTGPSLGGHAVSAAPPGTGGRAPARSSRDGPGRCERADRRLPARGDPLGRDRARTVDPAGGGGRAAGRQPAAGARGTADAGGRGAHRARGQQGVAGAAARPARGRRRLPDARAPRAPRAHREPAAPDRRAGRAPGADPGPDRVRRRSSRVPGPGPRVPSDVLHRLPVRAPGRDNPPALELHPAPPAGLHAARRPRPALGGQQRAPAAAGRDPPQGRRRRRALPVRAHPPHPDRARRPPRGLRRPAVLTRPRRSSPTVSGPSPRSTAREDP